LRGLQTTLDLVLDNDETRKINVGVCSALDFLYEFHGKGVAEDWFKFLLEQSAIPPEKVVKTKDYHSGMNISYHRPNPLTLDRFLTVAEYLAERFGLMFEIARMIFDGFAVVTQFDTTRFGKSIGWVETGRVFASRHSNLLPIMAAMNGVNYRRDFILDERLGPKGKGITGMEIRSQLIGISETVKRILLDVFWGKLLDDLDFLRTKKEMLSCVGQLSDEEITEIEQVDFKEYLALMGYSDMTLSSDEYIGVKGLSRIIEIHTLLHLNWDMVYLNWDAV
jgi:hypothetical protein